MKETFYSKGEIIIFQNKPMEEIINNIGDTVNILKIIKPVYSFKASE